MAGMITAPQLRESPETANVHFTFAASGFPAGLCPRSGAGFDAPIYPALAFRAMRCRLFAGQRS